LIPKLKADELLSSVVSLTLAKRRNGFVLKRFEKNAQSLLSGDQSSAFSSYMVLGIISCIRGDIEKMDLKVCFTLRLKLRKQNYHHNQHKNKKDKTSRLLKNSLFRAPIKERLHLTL